MHGTEQRLQYEARLLAMPQRQTYQEIALIPANGLQRRRGTKRARRDPDTSGDEFQQEPMNEFEDCESLQVEGEQDND